MKNILFVTLPEPLFLGGKNHQLKVFNGNGVQIEHDETLDHVKITYKDETATIKHYSSIVETTTPQKSKTYTTVSKPVRAQASTPHDHVFANGAGKTAD